MGKRPFMQEMILLGASLAVVYVTQNPETLREWKPATIRALWKVTRYLGKLAIDLENSYKAEVSA